jgi:hypothetical protein
VSQPDLWLRGPVAGVPPLLQPAAHALLQAAEDVERVGGLIDDADLWRRPGQAASIGYHLKHLIGATDRLMTYARGEPLTETQRAWLGIEGREAEPAGVSVGHLVERFGAVVRAALGQLESTAEGQLTQERRIGRAGLATTVIGCLFHAGEHAVRHAGQLITTTKALGGSRAT